MKALFKSMNLARVIIILSILGSIGLGWFSWKSSQGLTGMKDNLDYRVANLVKEIQTLAVRHTKLTKEYRNEDLKGGQANPDSYIRRIAAADKVEIGQVQVDPKKTTPAKGVVDKRYRIRPSQSDRDFPRYRIANFLYTLEQRSRRVRVTDVKIEAAQPRLKPHEVPNDRWKFDAEVTSRQAESGQ